MSNLVLSYNLTWCEAGNCDSLTNTHNITWLEPWRLYTITVTAVNMDPARVALSSPPLVQRTAASEPRNFIKQSVTAESKPELGNGPVSHYKVLTKTKFGTIHLNSIGNLSMINTFLLTGFC